MAHHDLGDGNRADEIETNSNRSQSSLTLQISSNLDVSSRGSIPGSDLRCPDVSTPSDSEGHGPYRKQEVDISHGPVLSIGSSAVASPVGRRDVFKKIPEARVGTQPAKSPKGFRPFRNTVSYNFIATPSNSSSRRYSSGALGMKRFSIKGGGPSIVTRHNPIPEEIDMSLLGSAQQIGMSFAKQKTAYNTGDEDEQEDMPLVSLMANDAYDISSLLGPTSPQTDAQLKEANRQEANGILTGGLGVGWKPKATLTITELYASAPQLPLSPVAISRRVSKKLPFRNSGMARASTLWELGQIEANKRGEAIEVIIEEEHRPEEELNSPKIDISSMEGGGGTTKLDLGYLVEDQKQIWKDTSTSSKVEVFYPQGNWKPFCMRWPYLTALTLISVTLAVAQEIICRRGALYTFNSPSELSTWQYFTFKYLPTLVAVLFGILWQVTDLAVKRLEPYYQLSKQGGALAAESINVDYITFFTFFRPFKALKLKHYAVVVSSIATLLAVSLVPTLQAASINLSPDRATRDAFPHGEKQIVINTVCSRILSVFLVLTAAFGCVLIYQLQTRPSGLVGDVKGIAGIAAMANRSHILMDFKNMDTASPEMIHNALKSHRYSLRNSSLAPEDHIPLTQEEKDKYDFQQRRNENPHPRMLQLIAGIPFIIGMVLLVVLIPVLLFNQTANIVTDKVPFLLTGLSVCIKLAWSTLETDFRMIEPFYILSKRHASPKVLTLDYSSLAFGWMPIRAFLNGHFLVGFVGLGSVLAEVLTVCATSFGTVSGMDFVSRPPNRGHSGQATPKNSSSYAGPDGDSGIDAGEETYFSFWVSFILALAILIFLCLVATYVYVRRRHPFLPRQPNTIASILGFIHQSKMLYDFVGTEKLNNDDMVERLVGIGKTYGLGWFTGRDGEMHCGVDEEELASNYKHGDDARKATMPWTTNWSDY